MAKPIKETPILKGKDARKFIREQQAPKDILTKRKEREEILKTYHLFKAAEKF